MKIIICGTAASGKSTIGKEIAKVMNYKHYSIGDLQRMVAKDKKISITEFGKLAEKDKRYDRMMDQQQIKIGQMKDNFVMDAWLGARFIPDSIKIFLDADIDTRVKRRLAQKRTEESHPDEKTGKKDMLKREKDNKERWIKLYGFDYTDKKNYDLVIDTTDLSIPQVLRRVLEYLKSKQNL